MSILKLVTDDGWEYVGPIAHWQASYDRSRALSGFVAFRRQRRRGGTGFAM